MTDTDISGRTRLGRNVLTSWVSQLVFIAFGFIMPRVIDEELGQASLGIWDFGWSIVSYLSFAMMGIGSSVNRYVARYRAAADDLALSRTISSVTALQLAIGLAVAAIAVTLSLLLPGWLGDRLGAQSAAAGHVILFLGLALSVQMFFDVFRGILTGCHQWSAYNALNAGGHAVTSIAMLVTVVNGGGLSGMAVAYFIMTVIIELIRRHLALRACPTIEFRRHHANREDMKKVFRFGMKTILLYVPRLVVQQTVMIFVIAKMGPAMLAILARPSALVGHAAVFVNKFSYVLTPTAGSLQGSGQKEELREFAMQSMRACWIFAILPLSFLFVLGDRLIELWMGSDYINWPVIAILAAGSVMPISQSATLNILAGMDEHGRVAKINLVVAFTVAVAGLLVISNIGWSLAAAAFLMILPSSTSLGFVALVIGCRELKISPSQYLREVLRDPLVILAISGLGLLIVRFYGPQSPLYSLAAGALTHALIAGLLLRKDLKRVIANL